MIFIIFDTLENFLSFLIPLINHDETLFFSDVLAVQRTLKFDDIFIVLISINRHQKFIIHALIQERIANDTSLKNRHHETLQPISLLHEKDHGVVSNEHLLIF